ncbi:MAG: leucine-rich repeat protein [Candidatus Methanomethylophilaceae archaeon]|nr:leucine-rich repeat protein [Candidatus Methanomethylophilaceae archaeon]
MTPRAIAILAAVCFLACCLEASDAAETCPDGSVYEYETHGSGHPDYYCVITSVDAGERVLHLPAVLEGYDVRTLASSAFDGCPSEAIVVPRNLKAVEDGAFDGCPALKDLYFMGDRPEMGAVPEGVKVHAMPSAEGWEDAEAIRTASSDGVEYAFLPDGAVAVGGSSEDGRIVVHGTIEGVKVSGVAEYAFAGTMMDDGNVKRRADVSVAVLEEGLSGIGQRAFYYCDLKEVSLPGTLESIGDEAFRACYLLEAADFPERLGYIGFEAFRECRALKSLDVSARSVGEGAFYICDGLESVKVGTAVVPRMFGYCSSLRQVEFGSLDGGIGYGAFNMCSSLLSVSMPDGVSEIGAEAFRDCVSLRNVDLNGTEGIGASAFRGCASLESLDLPSSLSRLGRYAFADCLGLGDVHALGPAPEGDSTAFLNVDAVVRCDKAYAKSWEDSGFGLEVEADRDGSAGFMAVAALAVFAAAVVAAVVLVRRRKRENRFPGSAEGGCHGSHPARPRLLDHIAIMS